MSLLYQELITSCIVNPDYGFESSINYPKRVNRKRQLALNEFPIFPPYFTTPCRKLQKTQKIAITLGTPLIVKRNGSRRGKELLSIPLLYKSTKLFWLSINIYFFIYNYLVNRGRSGLFVRYQLSRLISNLMIWI